MIILEGTDHVGKTRFAQLMCDVLAERFNKQPRELYGHMTRPPEDFDHVAEYMRNVRCGVQDRYHLGSIVYGRVLGGGTFPSARRMKVVQAYLRWRGCHVVVMTCARDVLLSRLRAEAAREEMYSVDRILDAGEAYRGLARSTNDGEPYCDEVVDVTLEWPGQELARAVVDRWWKKFMQ